MIYLVEDDESIRELVIYTLKSQGFEAKGFERPSHFWKALEKEKPALLLLDVMLPEEDGISILKKLRMRPDTRKLTETPGRNPGKNNTNKGSKCCSTGFPCRSADQIHRDQRSDKTYKYSSPEGGILQVHQRQIYKDHTEECKDKPQTSFYPLFSTDQAENQKVYQGKNIDNPFSVLCINTGNCRIASNTLHDNHLHTRFAGSSKQISGTACNIQLFSLSHSCKHTDTNLLLSHTGSVFLQIILKDFHYFCFLKCLSCPDHQLCFFHLIQFNDKNSERTDK